MESLTKAQLLELLKEHLTISITTQPQDDHRKNQLNKIGI